MELVAVVVPGEASRAVVVHLKDGDRVVAAEAVAGVRASVARVSGAAADSNSKVDLAKAVTEMVVVTTRVETGVAKEEIHGTRTASREDGPIRMPDGAKVVVALAMNLVTTTNRATVPVRCELEVATKTSDRHHTVWSRTTVTKVVSAQAAVVMVVPVETVGTRRFAEYKLAERGWDTRSIV